ncbi:HD-GYP domain-containing protein [Rugamonas sp. CCM 8940]|uniref:HD-GYP domain-containing protein n=1 Tax=Rugamonas sp. CCM 8940 TaxID=2765359 RepID=UPI0018F4B829|nr:HD-GYP domain-containing protein [Rugamonas sp. CCM 8940]MBJ7312238.1 HD-GYP domain-containing protein [Rugamonas sp. CCM 8940]
MLKQIEPGQLVVGMYVARLGCRWLASPFWKKSFLIESGDELAKIREAHIGELWIDTSKGRDVPSADHAGAPSPVAPEAAAAPSVAAAVPAAPVGAPAVVPAPPSPLVAAPPSATVRPVATVRPRSGTRLATQAPASIRAEMGRASKTLDSSKSAVRSMFGEARMGHAVEVGEALLLVEDIAGSVMRNANALISLARLKTADDYTYMHSVAVCALMIALARELKLGDDQVREAGLAGLLHDVGKMAIPLAILNKPGRLTEDEFDVVRTHPMEGYRMLLASMDIGAAALDVCMHHHEKMDGGGYPLGLKGEQISLLARMGAICDIYDAVTSNRPYKQGWCPTESLRKMAEWRGNHLDADLFMAFVKCVGIYPVGTLVRLRSGRLGVVCELTPGKPLTQPKLRVFFSIKSATYIAPEWLDLASAGCQDAIVCHEEAATWKLVDIDRYWMGE